MSCSRKAETIKMHFYGLLVSFQRHRLLNSLLVLVGVSERCLHQLSTFKYKKYYGLRTNIADINTINYVKALQYNVVSPMRSTIYNWYLNYILKKLKNLGN